MPKRRPVPSSGRARSHDSIRRAYYPPAGPACRSAPAVRRRRAHGYSRPGPRRGRIGGTMQTDLRGRDVIDFSEWTKDEIDTVLDVAFELKRDRALGRAHPYLRDKVLAMLFF